MSSVDALVDAITRRILEVTTSNKSGLVTYGTFVAAEDNPTLSHVVIDGANYRNIMKTNQVGALVAGNRLILLSGGPVPLTIVGTI